MVNYARYEALEYYKFRRRGSSNRKDVIIKGVYRLDPFTTPLHMLSLIVNQLTKYRYINTPTLKALLARPNSYSLSIALNAEPYVSKCSW